METLVSHVVDRLPNGTEVKRNFFFNNDKTNYLAKAHSYFTKHERKVAKLNYKANMK